MPEAVIDDAAPTCGRSFAPGLAEAVGAALDAAVFAGTNKPASWPAAIVPGALAAGNVNVAGNTPDKGGVVGDLDETFDLVEGDGYDVNGVAARRKLRSLLAQGARQRRSAARGRVDRADPRARRSRTSLRARSSTRRWRSWATTRWRSSASGRT